MVWIDNVEYYSCEEYTYVFSYVLRVNECYIHVDTVATYVSIVSR